MGMAIIKWIQKVFSQIKDGLRLRHAGCSCRKAGGYYLSALNQDGNYKHYKVPREVYQYVQQLEQYIKHPDISKLKEVYKERFGNYA